VQPSGVPWLGALLIVSDLAPQVAPLRRKAPHEGDMWQTVQFGDYLEPDRPLAENGWEGRRTQTAELQQVELRAIGARDFAQETRRPAVETGSRPADSHTHA
jgi:hypothetical protein